METADDIIDRLHQVYRVDSDTDLAHALGVAKSTISNWRSRNSKPFSICELVADQHGVSLDWLVSGKGEMIRLAESRRNEVREPPPSARLTLPEGLAGQEKRIEALLGLLSRLDPESRESILADAISRAATAQQLAEFRHALAALEARTAEK